MKIFLFLLLTSFITISNINPESDLQAVELLTKVSNKYSSYKTLKLSFIYKQTDIESKQHNEQQGILFLKKGISNYKIENDKLEIFANSKTVHTYIKDQNEIYINSIDTNFKALNPFNLININVKNKDYKVIFTDHTKNSSTITVLVLKSTPFYKIDFLIDNRNLIIKKINLYDRFGFFYEYIILMESHNINLPDNFFNFNKEEYHNAEIIDYRLLNNQQNLN